MNIPPCVKSPAACRRVSFFCLGACLLAVTVACVPFRPVEDEGRFFTMRPAEDVSLAEDAPSVRVDALRVPAFLDGRKIAVRRADAEVDYNAVRLWSEPFGDEARETLRAHLRLLGIDTPREGTGTLGRVSVSIDRFDATEDGDIRLESAWTWARERRERPRRYHFDADSSWQPGDHASLALGKSDLLRRLAESMAEVLLGED
ncbi:MAG: membrane integrity-associated transporter subunit PqiC [Opitutales bacterium]|nr:membrane integrity-associated transporter subunit PqiC [Opitutales bacterium]